jgi:hypothetical protein
LAEAIAYHCAEAFFSFADVKAMTENSAKRTFEYEMDGLTWSCEYYVKTWLSNNGYFYVNEDTVNVRKSWERSRKRGRRTIATRIHVHATKAS